MQARQEHLLHIIIKQHIKTAEPISSGFLVERFKLPYSPATVRNEMAKLEEDGFITQPYTSAGRIPTEKGYSYYIDNFLNQAPYKKKFFNFTINQDSETSIKAAARRLAKESELAVFWALRQNHIFYTGISNLLSQPEFSAIEKVINISRVIDHMDEIVNRIFMNLSFESQIFLGQNNPFGAVCGSIISKYKNKNQEDSLFGIIGPIRMDYDKCLGLVENIKKKLI